MKNLLKAKSFKNFFIFRFEQIFCKTIAFNEKISLVKFWIKKFRFAKRFYHNKKQRQLLIANFEK